MQNTCALGFCYHNGHRNAMGTNISQKGMDLDVVAMSNIQHTVTLILS